MNYFDDVNIRLELYKRKYARHPRLASLKMAVYCIFSITRSYKSDTEIEDFEPVVTDEGNIKICFFVEGGLGDRLFTYNYFHHLYERFLGNDASIDVYCFDGCSMTEVIFKDNRISRVIDIDYRKFLLYKPEQQYDLAIRINRYPNVLYLNLQKVISYSRQLVDYLNVIEQFKQLHPRFFNADPLYDGQEAIYEVILGKHRIQQIDINHYLSIQKSFSIDLSDRCDEKLFDEIMCSYPDRKVVLLANGMGEILKAKRGTKEWHVSYWNRLVDKLREKHKDLLFVQIGSGEGIASIDLVDLNLINRTGLVEVMGLLKRAPLLISVEGGMVHLRKAVNGGKSVVLFGPTDERFFGYEENINIRGKACDIPCEWNIPRWFCDCSNTPGNKRICMYSILPDMVASAVEGVLKEV